VRRIIPCLLPALSLLACGCDDYRSPRLAIATNAAGPGTAQVSRPPGGAPPARKGPAVYGGKTADQWAEALKGSDRDEIVEACRALHVLGREGREHLLQGLDCPHCETRRLCLATLTIADFKKKGEAGRQRLVKLAGDRDDVRVRERASFLLSQWHGSIPAP
jgi:hypothetical protein